MPVNQDKIIYPLSNGESLSISILEPPLGAYAEKMEYWWRDMRAQVLGGELVETSLDHFFVGEIDGAYVSSMSYATPRDTRDVAVLEMVWTNPNHRRKGIARHVLQQALDDFCAGGGKAMYLCTSNPHAFDLYYECGFRPLIGDGMRYLAPGYEDFDQTYFAPAGLAAVRRGTWGDLARISALYNQPKPAWFIKDYPRRVFYDTRYESHYIRLWKPASEGRGDVFVLENPARHVTGIAGVVEVDSYYEQHTRILDFWACPAYLSQIPDLLAAIIESAAQGATEIIQAYIAETDHEKRRYLEAAGFREEVRLRNRLRRGGQPLDLLLYSLVLDTSKPSIHLPSEYYGKRRILQSR